MRNPAAHALALRAGRRYNLKRKIAGLPPVTRDWYDARKAQLAATSAGAVQRVWFDPLTRKKFYSENTYLVLTRSKKYLDLVKRSGKPAPAAVVTLRRAEPAPAAPSAAAPAAATTAAAAAAGYTVLPAAHGGPIAAREARNSRRAGGEGGEEEDDGGSAWETASEEEMGGADAEEAWEEWDPRRSLFDNHESPSMEANLEYMWRKFGFYLPDAQYLRDPEALLKYLVRARRRSQLHAALVSTKSRLLLRPRSLDRSL
jgi:pre-60S factor REI1